MAQQAALKAMSQGSIVMSFWQHTTKGVIKQSMLLFYKPANSDSDPGHLYWCLPHKRTEKPDCCLPLANVAELCLGKQTPVLKHAVAADAAAERCFSII